MKTFLIIAAIVIRGRPKVSAPARPSGSLGRCHIRGFYLSIARTLPARMFKYQCSDAGSGTPSRRRWGCRSGTSAVTIDESWTPLVGKGF